MRRFKVTEQKNGELRIFELIGHGGKYSDVDNNRPIFEFYHAINFIANYCDGKKKVTIEMVINENENSWCEN